MKTVKFEGVMENAYGKALPEPIKYEGSFEAFQTIDEVNEKHEYPTEKEIVDGVNVKRKAAARQKQMQAALDAAGIEKPTLEKDVLLQLKTIYKVYIAAGKSEDEARKLAASGLGVEWPEGE